MHVIRIGGAYAGRDGGDPSRRTYREGMTIDSSTSSQEQISVGLIAADGGELLLQHRDDKPGLPGPGLWGFFGGHREPGERPRRAFLREMGEELGWQPRHFEHYLRRDAPALPGASAGAAALISRVYAAHLEVPLAALTLGEGQGLGLFGADALPAAIVPGIASTIKELVKGTRQRNSSAPTRTSG
jgi:8-oxo-dGTP diphosphatase